MVAVALLLIMRCGCAVALRWWRRVERQREFERVGGSQLIASLRLKVSPLYDTDGSVCGRCVSVQVATQLMTHIFRTMMFRLTGSAFQQ